MHSPLSQGCSGWHVRTCTCVTHISLCCAGRSGFKRGNGVDDFSVFDPSAAALRILPAAGNQLLPAANSLCLLVSHWHVCFLNKCLQSHVSIIFSFSLCCVFNTCDTHLIFSWCVSISIGFWFIYFCSGLQQLCNFGKITVRQHCFGTSCYPVAWWLRSA